MLKTTHLTKTHGDVTAVHDLNLEIAAGDIYCLLGPNGAGKTTTVNLFMGFINPDQGIVEVNGMQVSENRKEIKKFISFIPENLALYPNLTGLENLDFFTSLTNSSYETGYLVGLLTEAGLQQESFHKPVLGYSKGMRQKVGIAIAMAKKSKALILDEPTSGLDPQASNEFARLLVKLSEKGVAILMTTHDLFRARETGTRLGIMSDGVLRREFDAAGVSHEELEKVYLEQVMQKV